MTSKSRYFTIDDSGVKIFHEKMTPWSKFFYVKMNPKLRYFTRK